MYEPFLIDVKYIRAGFAASYLIVEGNEAVFVETGTSHSTPLLLKALTERNLEPKDVKFIIVTHAHLDHAGGAHSLMVACPNAQLVAHPKAARHLTDPSKLTKSAIAVYGLEKFTKLYGSLEAIPEERVIRVVDRQKIRVGGRELEFIYSLGHASHHVCIYDHKSKGIFTGDSFGLSYPSVGGRKRVVFPSTSPTDFDPREAKFTIQLIQSYSPKKAYLTHFGEISDLASAANSLIEYLDFSEALFEKVEGGDQNFDHIKSFFKNSITHFLLGKIRLSEGVNEDEALEILSMDIELNAQGMLHFYQQKVLPIS